MLEETKNMGENVHLFFFLEQYNCNNNKSECWHQCSASPCTRKRISTFRKKTQTFGEKETKQVVQKFVILSALLCYTKITNQKHGTMTHFTVCTVSEINSTLRDSWMILSFCLKFFCLVILLFFCWVLFWSAQSFRNFQDLGLRKQNTKSENQVSSTKITTRVLPPVPFFCEDSGQKFTTENWLSHCIYCL